MNDDLDGKSRMLIFFGIAMLITIAIGLVRQFSPTKFTIIRETTEFRTVTFTRNVSEVQLELLSAPMNSEWIEYDGFTPKLKLHVRGQSRENYGLFSHKYHQMLGPSPELTPDMKQRLHYIIMADAFVIDWIGPKTPNGKHLPYSPQALRGFMEEDPFLESYIALAAQRLGPPWP